MKPEQRNVEMLHKKNALGKWNVGIQKGIFKYDKATSDREREENILQGISDIDTGLNVQDFTVEDFDADIDRQARQEEMNEMYDFNMGSDNYADGNYYEEDRDTGDL
jgi:hypothetical protein